MNVEEARASLIHMLFDQVPEDWDENDIGILADAIEEWQASREVTEAEVEAMEREVTRHLTRLSKRDDWAEDDTAIGGQAAHIVRVALVAAREVRS